VRGILVPPRRRGIELLEEPGVDPALVRRSLADVTRSNRLFGGTRAVIAEIHELLGRTDSPLAGNPTLRDVGTDAGARRLTLLDVGTGAGDIPAQAHRLAHDLGVTLTTFGLDESETLAAASGAMLTASIRGDARAIPCASSSVDIVTCSQVLHHFPDDQALQVIRELDRVARRRVIISDLRRSWLAAAGIWLASYPLGFHPVSRHDGVVSVMRGYTPDELSRLVVAALRRAPTVHRRIGFRVTASWTPENE
jgi:2-polyprenyl-3-methyl-5-hydroxy-6-metoxy-1,4-benzoquinol methylase